MDPYMPMDNSLCLLPWVRLLMLMRDANPKAALDNALGAVAPPFSRSMYEVATQTTPAWYYAQLNGVSFLLIDGVTRNDQAILLTAGYVGVAHPAIRNPQNAYLNSAAQAIVMNLRNAGFPPPVNLRIGGYSMGGAIAPFIPWWVRTSSWGDDRGSIITFGAPKCTGFRNAQSLDVATRCHRVMCDDDPIPLFPPSALDYPAVIALVGPIHAARIANFVHCGRGTLLSREGTLAEGTQPSMGGVAFGVSFSNWLFAVENDPANPHALNEYEKRLLTMAQNNAHAFHVPEAHFQRNEEVARNELTQAEARVAEAIAHSGAVQGHDPVVIPTENAFWWQRVGRINCVVFGGKLITITNTKRRAQRLARSGNDFIRTLQKQAVVDPVSITGQFEEYFTLAMQENSGFRPVLQTVFPAVGN